MTRLLTWYSNVPSGRRGTKSTNMSGHKEIDGKYIIRLGSFRKWFLYHLLGHRRNFHNDRKKKKKSRALDVDMGLPPSVNGKKQ